MRTFAVSKKQVSTRKAIATLLRDDRQVFIKKLLSIAVPPIERTSKNAKCFFRLGGPIDLFEIGRKRFFEVDPPKDKTKPYNPFVDLFIKYKLPDSYHLTQPRRKIIVYTIYLAKILYELAQSETIVLSKFGTYIPNARLMLQHLNFNGIRTKLLPFVVGTTEQLLESDRLTDDLKEMYSTVTELLCFFKDTLIDDDLGLPASIKESSALLRQLRAA